MAKTPVRCSRCGQPAPVARKTPWEKAFDHLNPRQVHHCEDCNLTFWAAKPLPQLLLAASLAVLVAAFLLHAVLQLVLLGLGYTYGPPRDATRLTRNLPSGLECPACGSSNMSRSTLQPLARTVSWISPLTPYRCLDCWRRLWRPKPWPRLVLALALAATLGFAFRLIHHRYHERRRQVLERRT